MKKNFLAVISFVTILVSCTSTTEEMTGLEALSTNAANAITTYVANNFPDTKIVYSETSNGTVTTELNTGEELKFNTDGVFVAYSNNSVYGLPADSLSLISDSTRNDSTFSRHHERDGKHEGKGGKHGGKHGGRHDNDSFKGGRGHNRYFENDIAIDSLASGITSYISSNYSGYTVLHAETDTICEGVVTEVFVSKASAQPIKLVFDSVNVFIFKAERIEYANVPASISAAIALNYTSYTVMQRCEVYTFTDNSLKYKIYLRNTESQKAITFNADGTISCEK